MPVITYYDQMPNHDPAAYPAWLGILNGVFGTGYVGFLGGIATVTAPDRYVVRSYGVDGGYQNWTLTLRPVEGQVFTPGQREANETPAPVGLVDVIELRNHAGKLMMTVTGLGEVGTRFNYDHLEPVPMSGAEVYVGSDRADSFQGWFGDDTIDAGGGDDLVVVGDGADVLDGGTGLDTARFMGNRADFSIESLGGGRYRVTGGSASATLTNVERLQFSDGVFDLYGVRLETVGDVGRDVLTGDSAPNTIRGGYGDDILNGGAGGDFLFGGIGEDVLDGGTGADVLTGGAGDDTYHVDQRGDQVIETANEGVDTIYAAVSWGLSDTLEHLVLTGSATQGSGNAQANRVFGNGFDNTLNGNGGDDLLEGRGGADTLNGGDGNDTLDGGNGADRLSGGSGDDRLTGGLGNDRLDGGRTSPFSTPGLDVAVFSGPRVAYDIIRISPGVYEVRGLDGIDTLVDVEVIEFIDQRVELQGLAAGESLVLPDDWNADPTDIGRDGMSGPPTWRLDPTLTDADAVICLGPGEATEASKVAVGEPLILPPAEVPAPVARSAFDLQGAGLSTFDGRDPHRSNVHAEVLDWLV